MIFEINSKEFLRALNFAGKFVPSSGITPIYECVMIESKSNKSISITGSDTQSTIKSECAIGGADSVIFKIAAPYELLSKTLSGLPNTAITVSYSEEGDFDFKMQILCGDDIYKIPCEDPSTFLKLPSFNQSNSFDIKGADLSRALWAVAHCVSNDDLRPAMTGVYMNINDGSINFAATNGHILADYMRSFEDLEVDVKAIIPSKFAKFISDSLSDSDQVAKIAVSPGFLSVEFEGWIAYSRLIDERFPDYKNAIPTDFISDAVINSESLKASLRRAQVYASNSTNLAKFSFYGPKLQLEADETELNRSATQNITIESDIDEFTIGFNVKILSGLLSTVSGDFTFKFSGPNRAAMIFPETNDDEELKYLIMPVMLNN